MVAGNVIGDVNVVPPGLGVGPGGVGGGSAALNAQAKALVAEPILLTNVMRKAFTAVNTFCV